MSEVDSECLDGGLIVGMADPLPEDPSQRYVTARQWVGCNRIFCKTCRCWTRHLDGVRIWAGNQGNTEFEQLYAAEDPGSLPYFTKGAGGELFRTYFCRCSFADTSGIKPLPYVDSADGWYCAGHPPSKP